MKNADEGTLKYNLTIDTPSGRCQIATSNWQLLMSLIDPFACTDSQYQDLYTAAKRAQIAYHKSFKRAHNGNSASPLARNNDLEIQVITCYLRGWDTYKTVNWLFDKKNHKTSKSAIG
jgi:hypothetical protein